MLGCSFLLRLNGCNDCATALAASLLCNAWSLAANSTLTYHRSRKIPNGLLYAAWMQYLCTPTLCTLVLQDPVDNAPAVLVKRYNITEQKHLKLQLTAHEDALQRLASFLTAVQLGITAVHLNCTVCLSHFPRILNMHHHSKQMICKPCGLANHC